MTDNSALSYTMAVTVERLGLPPRRVEFVAPADATAGDVIDRLAAHLGAGQAAGAVFGQSALSGTWIRRDASIPQSGLLRGEHLRLMLGLTSPERELTLSRWSVVSPAPDATGRIPVNRPPRAPAAADLPEIAIPVPPEPPVPRRFPTGALVIPLVLGLVLVVVTRHPEVALFSLFSPLMVLWNRYEDKHAGKAAFGAAGRAYEASLAAVVAQATEATQRWAAHVRDVHPSPAQTLARLTELSPRLWERRPGDADFLELRLGTTRGPAPAAVRAEQRAVPTPEARARVDAAVTVDALPVTVSLDRARALALVGPQLEVDDLVRWLMCQLCVQHSPRDVAVAAILSDGLGTDWPWWLPHAAERLFDGDPVVFGSDAGRRLLADVSAFAAQRAAAAGSTHRQGVRQLPILVLVIDARSGIDPALYTPIIETGGEAGIVTIWIGADDRMVPGASSVLVTLEGSGRRGLLVDHRSGDRMSFVGDGLDLSKMDYAARALAPLLDATSAAHAGALPDRVLLDALQPELGSPAARRRAWESASPADLWSCVGVSATGPFQIDLGSTGSHVLVGGTTGSGKSELLQTMVISLAAQYPPDRVSFLFVDYKGGTAFKDAVRLPHCVGLVTDLDGHLTRRVLVALDAEIRRREQVLLAAGARDLAELRGASPAQAPADLIIVVDEFAALAKEVPEFVEGVVDIAARGRALGLRLVLATQRPAGVVNDRIRANVGLRIGLRVNDESDSQDVLDSRDAAHISRNTPGRAIARVHRDLVEFQSAYVGAPAAMAVQQTVTVRDLAPDLPAMRVSGPAAAPSATLLDAVVDTTNKLMQLGRWPRPHAPWLPPLGDVVTIGDLATDLDGAPLPLSAVLLGRTDEPERQLQRVLALDFDQHQNLLVYGTSRSGKTTALRTIAAGLIARSTPSEVTIYGLDFGSHGLRNLAPAPHCGGIASGDDPGRVARLLRRLRRDIDERKRLLADRGRASYSDLLADGAPSPPRIVVLLDSYAGFTAAFERVDGGRLPELLQRLVAEGPAVGVHFVITADRRAAVPGALASVITTRLVLRMAEKDDYSLLGVDPALARAAELPPGRGFVQGHIEVQIAALLADPSGQAQAGQLDVLVSQARQRCGAARAVEVGSMPSHVRRAQLPAADRPLTVPLGIGDQDLTHWLADLSVGHFLVAGASRTGRSTTLGTIAVGLRSDSAAVRLVLVAPRRTPLAALEIWDAVVTDCSPGPIAAALARYDDDVRAGTPLVVFCDDVEDVPDDAAAVLETAARRGRDDMIRLVIAAESRAALRSYTGVLPEVRKSKQGVLLSPDVDLDGDLLGVRLRAPVETLAVAGRGFAVSGGLAELVQVAE